MRRPPDYIFKPYRPRCGYFEIDDLPHVAQKFLVIDKSNERVLGVWTKKDILKKFGRGGA